MRSIPTILERGLITLEDRRYYDHLGVDPQGILRALWTRMHDGRSEGASTITMGLARNLLGVTRDRSIGAKLEEIALAIRLELAYSKSEILRLYLERIEFGRLSIGVASAARAYFGVELGELTTAEQIALLTMIKNPGRYDLTREPEAFRIRYIRIVGLLRDHGVMSPSEADIALEAPLRLADTRPELPYIRDMVRSGAYTKDQS